MTFDKRKCRQAALLLTGLCSSMAFSVGQTTNSFSLKPTVPDAIFSSHTTTTFTATMGAGIKINHLFGEAPLECGYRFFYLGQGHFNAATSQVLNNLSTGSV